MTDFGVFVKRWCSSHDGVVYLGIPHSKAMGPGQDTQPYVSKLGGCPVAQSSGSLSAEALTPTCRVCGDSLCLVAQVYAPVTGPRTLYIFGCNRSTCDNAPGSWRVLRSQCDAMEKDAPVELPPPPPSIYDDKARLHDVRDGGVTVDSWADDGGDWGASDGDGGEDGDGDYGDLLELLKARDLSLAEARAGKGSSNPTKPKVDGHALKNDACNGKVAIGPHESCSVTEVGIDNGRLAEEMGMENKRWFEAFEIVQEPEESGGTDYAALSDDAIEARLQRYLEEEEDQELVAVLKEGGSLKGRADSLAPRPGLEDEEYEKAPPAIGALLKFQERIARRPEQVLRYAYGGEPLWSTHEPPRIDRPACASCGAARRFEMQLMPAVLSVLNVDAFAPIVHGKEDEVPDSPGADGTPLNRKWRQGGMDWGVVAVFSCEESCRGGTEEVVIVQPPVDAV